MATSGRKPNWSIKPLPKAQRVVPSKGTLRAQCLAKMQKGGLTIDGAIALCRAYALIRLVATRNGYGAKEKSGRVRAAV